MSSSHNPYYSLPIFYKRFIFAVSLVGIILFSSFSFHVHAQSETSFNQSTTTSKAVMIAGVDILGGNASIVNNTIAGTFIFKSSMGDENDVRYGVVLRSKKDGSLLATSPSFGSISLREGEQKTVSLTKELPIVYEDALVYLSASNKNGLPLSLYYVGDVDSKGVSPCITEETSITCTYAQSAKIIITLYEGGSQGTIISTSSLTLSPSAKRKIDIPSLFTDKKGGNYIVGVSLVRDGIEIASVAKEYFHFAKTAKIVNAALSSKSTSKDEVHTFSVTVFTQLIGISATSQVEVMLAASSCGDDVRQRVSTDSPVTSFSFSTLCTEGSATILLLVDGKEVDSYMTAFSIPKKVITQSATTKKEDNSATSSSFIEIILVVLASLFVLYVVVRVLEKKSATMVVLCFIVSAGYFLVPAPSFAATYAIAGGGITSFCPGTCGGMMDEMNYWPVGGTVTVPSSAGANTTYAVSVTQYMTPDGTGGSSGGSINCLDFAGDGDSCDSADVRTTVSKNGGSVGQVAHLSSGTVNVTASPSGTDTLSLHIHPYAPYYVGCNSAWLSPTVKCFYQNDPETFSVDVPVTQTPTVNLFFSFIKNIIPSVFALEG